MDAVLALVVKGCKMFIGMNYVNGGFCPTRPDFENINPATEDSLGSFPESTE